MKPFTQEQEEEVQPPAKKQKGDEVKPRSKQDKDEQIISKSLNIPVDGDCWLAGQLSNGMA